MVESVQQLNYHTTAYHKQLTGIAREVAEQFAVYAKTIIDRNLYGLLALIAGGETGKPR